MKYINILPLLAFILILNACKKDTDRFDYGNKEKISIVGINDSYEKISMIDSLSISPTVTSSVPNSKFEYYWGIYEKDAPSGYILSFDTLSKTRELHSLVKQSAKSWVLVFCVKNTKTGYLSIKTSTVNVSTQFTRGWYVQKDDGNKTDVDLFLTPSNITPESKVENVFSLVNGKRIDGTAKHLRFDSRYKADINVKGSFANTRVMFLITNNDVSVVDVNTFREIHDFNGLFYSPPKVKTPNTLLLAASGSYFMNDGQIHSLNNVYSSIGLYGNSLMKDVINTSYNLSDYFLSNPSSNPYVFDQKSSSFLTTSILSTSLLPVKNDPETKISATNNNKSLLYLGLRSIIPFTGVAIFKDKTNPSLKTISVITPSATSFKITNDTIQPTSKLYRATKYTCNLINENMLYFVLDGNQVWSRNLTNNYEQLQFTAPAGEIVTFITHRQYSDEPAFAYNFVIVGTKNGANYSVRMFAKTAGNLASAPTFTLTGTGSASDVLFLSPTVIHNTYPSTF